MELSKYQKEIEKTFLETNKNIAIDAGPGCGKSFVLTYLAKKAPTYKKLIFLAFNKSIASELEKKLPPTAEASTIHSCSFRTFLRYYKIKVTVKENKTFILLKRNLKTRLKFKNPKLENAYYFNLCKIYDLWRMNLLDLDIQQISQMAENYDIEWYNYYYPDFQRLVEILNDYNSNLDNGHMIDFTDMLWLLKDVPKTAFRQYDIVQVDEFQDLNKLQQSVVEKLIKPNGRFVIVGDEKQSIYSFMGSVTQVFKDFKNKPNTITLPLSVSYRCAKSVIEEANQIFPDELPIEANETNIEGEVRDGKISEIQEGDYVLCRNNKPLVELWLKLLKQGKSAYIYGKDYAETLLKLLSEVEDFIQDDERVQLYFEDKLSDLEKDLKINGVTNPLNSSKYNNLLEKISILKILYLHYKTYENLGNVVNSLFSDELKGITLMTCHKSKGLENDRVFIYRRELIPSKYANSEIMLRAEKCLAFVAITRAKKALIYINDSEKESEESEIEQEEMAF